MESVEWRKYRSDPMVLCDGLERWCPAIHSVRMHWKGLTMYDVNVAECSIVGYAEIVVIQPDDLVKHDCPETRGWAIDDRTRGCSDRQG